MKQSILDTDILSAFLRGNGNVTQYIDQYLTEYGFYQRKYNYIL